MEHQSTVSVLMPWLHQPLEQDQHLSDVVQLVNNNKSSDSFANHFAQHFKNKEKIKRNDGWALIDVEIIWQGNPISCMKSFCQLDCCLCMKERVVILKATKEEPKK